MVKRSPLYENMMKAQHITLDSFSVAGPGYRAIKSISLSTEEMYGLEAANIEIEKVPIMVGPAARVKIKQERE